MVVPSLAVVAAWFIVGIAFVGLVKPEMVNMMGWPPVNVPEVNDTVKTEIPPTLSDAVPAAPEAGAVNATAALPEFARVIQPRTVMMILPLLGTVDTGVSETVMVTDVAPRALLLRVMAGKFGPRSPMLGYVPVALDPTMVPSLAVVTAGTLLAAEESWLGLMNPGMENMMGWPPVNDPEVNETVK